MREIELKSVVPDERESRRRLTTAGAALVFEGTMLDRRYDTPDRSLAARDEVLRLRVERGDGRRRGQLDFKGAASFPGGYKVREETGTPSDDPDALLEILTSVGYVVTREIDREVAVYVHRGATVRFERYPRMDVLVEVEGEPAAIEAAIEALALPRSGFTNESLAAFVRRYEERTNGRAAIFAGELSGDFRYRLDDA
jgi:predicted adenylyl cyclase CyaB